MTEVLSDVHAAIATDLCDLLEVVGLDDVLVAARLLSIRVRQPRSYVTLVGETSTGKSTLANGLLADPVLPAFASPTTAAVTHVALRDGQPTRFTAIYRDATQQEIDRDVFLQQSEEPIDVLLRLQVTSSPSSEGFDGLQVFDTPGYNAVMVRHEEVLRQFLPSSDLVVFVAGYRTGFGQEDQDLLEVVQSSLEDDPEIPIVLVVNRAPLGTTADSKRVSEIHDNAVDCLQREPRMHIVFSTTATAEDEPVPDISPPPDTEAMWRDVKEIVIAPERQAVVAQKLEQMLRQLLQETDDALERRQLRAEASESETEEIRQQLEMVSEARDQSMEAVTRSTERLSARVEPAMRRGAEQMLSRLIKEVDDSNKWLEKEGCAAWLTEHAMPFEAKRAARIVEGLIDEELQRLDRELEDIANTTVERLERSVEVRSDAAKRFAINLGRAIVQRVGGAAISSALKGLGGVGGMAAGTGNLVKMVVSRAGRLFGKTFSREVYNQIGRTFTKRAVQRLAGALQIVIEVVVYVVDSKRWQTKMKKELEKAVEDWRDEVLKDLRSKTIVKIEDANRKLVRSIYDDLLDETRAQEVKGRARAAADLEAVADQRSRIAQLMTQLENAAISGPNAEEAP